MGRTVIHLDLLQISNNEESDIPLSVYHELVTETSLRFI